MPPFLATLVCALGVLVLFWLDRDRDTRTSPALWLPVLWLAIGGSRNVSVWFGATSFTASPEEYLEGSPLDRMLLTGLITVGLGVLTMRGRLTWAVLRRNAPFLIFFLYCAVSATWSDFPFVTLKRWTKAVGNLTMVLIVLTDPYPAVAVKKFLARTAFLLIPASVLLIKYYPELGRYYDQWVGTAYYGGVTGDKNMLGCICMVLGLGIVSRVLDVLPKDTRQPRTLLALGVVFAMILWLFSLADSATSVACFIVGAALITVLGLSRRARPARVHLIVAVIVGIAIVSYTFQDVFAFVVQSLGRDTSLTGRTDLWNELLGISTQPWLGAGFESFFLGGRLELLWRKYWWHPNEAHNGYLETYLTLGVVGLALLGVLVVTGYRNVMSVYRTDPGTGALRLAFLVVALIYNVSEAAFKVMNPLWIVFLFAVTAAPVAETVEAREPVGERAPGRSGGRTAGVTPSGAVGALGSRPVPVPGRPIGTRSSSRARGGR
jgi:exopolysaccharide production protein ExoQ